MSKTHDTCSMNCTVGQLLSKIKIKHFILEINLLASLYIRNTLGHEQSGGEPFWFDGNICNHKNNILRGKQFCAGARACGSWSRASVYTQSDCHHFAKERVRYDRFSQITSNEQQFPHSTRIENESIDFNLKLIWSRASRGCSDFDCVCAFHIQSTSNNVAAK